MCDSVMSWSHSFKGGAIEEAFPEQWFLWERWPLWAFFNFNFNFFKLFYMHKNLYKTLKEIDEILKKHNRSP